MFRTPLYLVVFLAGLLAVCWIGAGYVGSNPVGLAVALVIAACYGAGAVELHRYRQATAGLGLAVAEAATAPASLGEWLEKVPAGLRNAVRLRVEGERVALPAPVLTPYLVGLLVLLGMLGTLLGMMATLRGTGLALGSATDLQSIRGSLGAPVEGLAVAFGTSIAGVATSAMLGLLSALCRRERLLGVQQLDTRIATTLHVHSQAWQRAEAFRLLQAQAGLMPALVDRLEAMSAAIEAQSGAAGERLSASQDTFHARAEAAHERLAGSVQEALQASVAQSARAVGEALQPIMAETMAGISQQTTALQATVGDAVRAQLDGLASGFEASRAATTETWNAALSSQKQAHDTLSAELRSTLATLSEQHDQRAVQLLETLAARLDASVDAWTEAQGEQQQRHAALTHDLRTTLEGFSQLQGEHGARLLDAVGARLDATAGQWQEAQALQQQTHAALIAQLDAALERFGDAHSRQATALVDTLSERMDSSAGTHAQAWRDALQGQQSVNAELAERNQQALVAATASFDGHARSLVDGLQASHSGLQDRLEARDAQRLATWSDAFTQLSEQLGQQWADNGAQVAASQQAVCETLSRTAHEIGTQAQAHAAETIAEISRLVTLASEAPKAAAEVVAELRQKLSDSMVRDTAMLDERTRLLATLETLLDAVNHASTEQRTAVDALVSTSADLLERVGTQFTDHIAAETGKLDGVAAQLSGSAVEVASLADAFGTAMQSFGTASTGLGEQLQQVAGALDASMTRSDEQLAYYVTQAREVIDLSVLSQQQIIEELQQLAGRRRNAGTATA
ncbi:DUF802 domain-containing protein [Stenotrophomonas sp. PS02300]|uniref:DUF802 domain-containing protein n=1 Tax=Stenotrophomonas sp. PS02300 TaxID=2991426 RepID=UPI00249A02AC|nr:DUF802 domain-containing protein [Stenotrophomonas sp. PS02300]